jgi:DNA-binding response OmpR family regulator
VIAAVYPDGWSEDLTDGLTLAGATVTTVTDLVPDDRSLQDADVLVVELGPQPMRRLREVSRIAEAVGLPVLLTAAPDQMVLLESAVGVTEFIVTPVDPVEFRLRLRRLHRSEASEEILRFKDLVLNNPVRVWSREQLLSKVWGYDYYGGARTVDVHVRRLRAKLGEERSSWITTVRSVGYRFG